MNTGNRVRSTSISAGVTLLSSLVVALAVLFVLDAAPVLGAAVDASGGSVTGLVASTLWVGHGLFVVGYLLLAVGTVASALAAAWSRRSPGPVPRVSAVVVLAGVGLVVVGAGAILGDVTLGPPGVATFAFLSVGVPPALLVVAYNVAAIRSVPPVPKTPKDLD